MSAAVDAGGGGGLQSAFASALEGAKEAQGAELEFQSALNSQKSQFQADSAKLEMEDAMATKMARLASRQAQALAQ